MYPDTRRQGKSPRRPNATLTAGLRCAPDTLPMNNMVARTIKAGATTAAVRPIVLGKACDIMAPLLRRVCEVLNGPDHLVHL